MNGEGCETERGGGSRKRWPEERKESGRQKEVEKMMDREQDEWIERMVETPIRGFDSN